MSKSKEIEELVTEATQRAIEAATVQLGRGPSMSEAGVVLLQAQVAMLAASLLEEDELITFYRNVIEVIIGQTPRGLVS